MQNQQQLEEMKRKREEENRAKIEEANRQRMAEQQRQQEERRRQLEEQKKRHEEQRATIAVRRAIHKLRMAMPDNIEQLSAEMEAVLMKELSGCGPSAQKLHGEKEQAVAFATDRVAKIKEATQKDEERKAQLEAEYKEAYEKAEALQKELDETGNSSNDKIKVCTDFVVQKGPGMKEPAP